MYKDIDEQLNAITDRERVNTIINLSSMYLLVFENFKSFIVNTVKETICDFKIENS